jgi:hypothetical protein
MTIEAEIIAWATVVSTVFIAIFTAVLGCFTISLARSTRIAADAANLSAKVAQSALADLERPYVFIETEPDIKRRLGRRAFQPAEGGAQIERPMIPRVKFRFVNHGRTPAIIGPLLKRELSLHVSAPGMDGEIQQEVLKNEIVLAPNGGESDWLHCDFTGSGLDELEDKVVRRRATLWFRAWISYRDVFKKKHLTPAYRLYWYEKDALLPDIEEDQVRS